MPTKSKAEAALATEMIAVTVIDRLNHDGSEFGPGERLAMSAAEAATLRDLGVVSWDELARPATVEP